jgi:hypothetical protein
MLADIFMLRLEAAARAVKEAAATSSSSRFVPITLPVAGGELAPMKPGHASPGADGQHLPDTAGIVMGGCALKGGQS